MKSLNMRPNLTKGYLFTFCGLDGCGKTTMLTRLKEDLENQYGVFLTKQPTNAVRESEIFRTYMDNPVHDAFEEDGEGKVRGIVVHEYIAKYVDKLFDGSIPYERMDRRVLRLIWEHKKVMLERIEKIEQSLHMNNEISKKYKPLVAEADTMRMLYASHHMKRRDSVLPIIKKKLLKLMENERELLTLLVEETEERENEAVEISQK